MLFEKEPSKVEVINDLNNELVCFWRVIQHHLQPFIDGLRFAIISRQVYEWQRMSRPETLTDIQRAIRFYYLQRLTFAGKTKHDSFGTSATQARPLNLSSIEETLLHVHWRLKAVTVEKLDAIRCIERYDRPTTVFYIDPPYLGNERSYAVHFEGEDFNRLLAALKSMQGRFILSINDCHEAREMFSAFNIKKVSLTYTSGNPRTSRGTRGKERNELLISNFKILKKLTSGSRRGDSFSKSADRIATFSMADSG